MVSARGAFDHIHAWNLLQLLYSKQRPILVYLEERYIPFIEEFAHPFISRLTNFGHRTASSTESAHRALRNNPVTGTSSLLRVVEMLQPMMAGKKINFESLITLQHPFCRVKRPVQRGSGGGCGRSFDGRADNTILFCEIMRSKALTLTSRGAEPSQACPIISRRTRACCRAKSDSKLIFSLANIDFSTSTRRKRLEVPVTT